MQNSRREFLRSMMRELVVTVENLHGRENVSLDRLEQLPDSVIGAVIPCRRAGVTIVELDGVLHAQISGRARTVALFAIETDDALILAHFNGHAPLGDIAAELAAARGVEASALFHQVRSLFSRMAKAGLYVPLQP